MTRDQKPFFSFQFSDLKRTVTTVIWSDSQWFEKCQKDWSVGGYYRINGILFENDKYGLQLEIRDIRDVSAKDKVDGFSESDFVTRSRFDSENMFTELLELLGREFQNEAIKVFVLKLLATHQDVIKRLPASNNRYHPFAGGWLEHTLSLCKTSLWLTDHYRGHYSELTPPLNRDLVLAGAALHEIGRVIELSIVENGEAIEQSIPGRLLGHSILARDMIREAAREHVEIDPEFLALLEHLLLTHLSLPEWGSPRLPAIPEVLIIHHADDLDAKLEMYVRCLANDSSDGPFTERDPILNKPLLKQRRV